MDKIQKALSKLSVKEKRTVKDALRQLFNRGYVGLDIQRLQGHKEIFRIRKGSIRIIYRQTESEIFLMAIERRSEKTYKKI